jgi:uncharacterized protein YcbK (DUF882 family)
MRLTPHFTLEEFACHDGTPAPSHARDDLVELCRNYLEPLRARFGPVTVRSGYRTAEYNRRVGGAPASFHVYRRERKGAAADVTAATGDAADWYRALARLDPPGLGSYPDHVHVDTRAWHARW